MKPSEILEKAAAHIERVGLHKGCYFLDGSEFPNPETPCCGKGATIVVRAAAGLRPWCREQRQALKAMDDVTGGDFVEFNDAPERTQAEVVAKLREAAERARKDGR